ncbi:helicase-associated domain-containing protein [Arthrobacter sp. USHLN218]|uniref:helicase-associated domain-containing protein n=1 Tax=Arthrobacter sp. USHLN218 TaxID=3081232 RepID=UPI00301B3043
MSSIRALAHDLAARSNHQLRELFLARPDLCLPPVPDFPALAARACTRVSLQRALEKLNRPELELLEALVLATDVDTGTATDATGLAPLLAAPEGVAPDQPVPYLRRLHALGLLVRADGEPPAAEDAENNNGGGRHCAYLPLASLVDVLGPYPAALGRSHRTLAALNTSTGGRLAAVATALGAAGHPLAGPAEDGAAEEGGAGEGAAAALESWLQQPDVWPALLADAPPKTVDLLERFHSSPVGAVPDALRPVDVAEPLRQPVPWLLAHGLLVPLDNTHVELPRAVGLLLRGGAVADPWHVRPPLAFAPEATEDGSFRAGEAGTARPAIRDNAAYSAVAETLRLMSDLLGAAARSPVATLRAGGVGVREVRRLADELQAGTRETGWLLELAAAAGLLVLDVDTSRWVPHGAEGYAALDRQLQWQLLATAWLELGRAPSLAGTPTVGSAPSPPRRGTEKAAAGPAAPRGAQINVLAAEAARPDAPPVRRRMLAALAELTRPAAPDRAGAVPAPSSGQVIAYLGWQSPRQQRKFDRLVPGMLDEAASLGLLGSGALTAFGALLLEDPAAAAELLAGALPAPLAHFMLQGDLTAVAPGYLEPAVARQLQELSSAEGQGPAAIHRFSADSIRRALDAGRDAPGILAFLERHSATGVPQPLRYLVEDTAGRHGAIRVGSAGSYLRSEDPDLLDDLLADPRAAGLGLRRLAPTVLAAPASAAELLASLRSLGYSPAPDRDGMPALGTGSAPENTERSARTEGAIPPSFAVTTNPWQLTEEDLQAQLELLHGSAADGAGRAAEAEPLLALETLRRAIRMKKRVRMGIVDPHGNHRREILQPLSVGGGRLRVADPDRGNERVVPIHRVMDIELVEDTGSEKEQTDG